MRFRVAIRVLCLLVAGTVSYGQDYRGAILGRVTDTSTAVIPKATVVVTNEGTNIRSTTETNGEGNYLLPLLEPGLYRLTADAPGFRQVRRTGITVRTGDRLELNLQLEVGASAESITVAAEIPLLQTTSADLAQVIDRRFIDLLYTADRNPLGLISLTAGVRGGGGRFIDSAQHLVSINGGGASTGSNEVVVDGASVVMPRQGGAIGTSPSADAVEELRVQTTMFDAAYGHSNGGVITYATRAGTNDVHGSIEGFLRNKALNANTWLNNKNGLPRPDDNRQLYSGAVGGPVYIPKVYDGRSRTFFFTSMQVENVKNGRTFSGRVPSELERNGDFSQTLSLQGTPLTVYNPYTTVVSGTTVKRQPFPDNKIPASMFDPTGKTIMNVYPTANISGPSQIALYNWASQATISSPSKQFSQRIDQLISSKQRLFGRFAYMVLKADFKDVPRGLRNAPIGGDPNADFRHFWNASLNDDYAFAPNLIGSLRYSYARYWSDTWFPGNTEDPTELNLSPQILANQMRPAWPAIDMAEGFVRLGHRFKIRANDTHSLVPTLTKLAGSHSLRFGGEIRQVSWNEISPDSAAAGYFNFRTSFTSVDPFLATANRTSGTAMASLLLGLPESGNISGPTPYSVRSYFYSSFVQDDWRLTNKLTLNIGLRWELETPYTERFNRLAYGFDFTAPNPVKVPGMDLRGGLLFAGVDGNPRQQGKTDWNNFGPRFGFAYQLRPTTVIRGGYGLFYASALSNLDTSIPVPPTFSTAITYVGTTDRGATPLTTLQNPFPNGVTAPPGASRGLESRIGEDVSFVSQDKVLPYAQQWQFGIQQSLPSQIRFEIAFVRMLSVKGLEEFSLNEKPDRYLALEGQENTKVANPFYGHFPPSSPLGSSSTISQGKLWVAYPQFNRVTMNGANTHTTVYHALQLSVEKRLTHGLSLIWNHTISKMIENNISSLVNERHWRSISNTDRPHAVNLAAVYDLPFGSGKPWLNHRGVVNTLAGGWSLSGRLFYGSGFPLGISDSNGRPIRLRNASLSGPIRDRIGDRLDPVTRAVLNPYFDTTAFQSLPTQYMVWPEPPNFAELRAPHDSSVDVSVVKRIKVNERLSFDARADASSLMNTPQWDSPGTAMSNKATFGVIQNATGNRRVQLTFRAVF